MKSFFKKLAFVMALAMVVSMAAPAATTAKAEEKDLQIAYQNGMAITEVNIAEVGGTEDLRFLNAPNWKTDGVKWSSNNEAVATVDQTGLVTAVADGTATISVAVGTKVASVDVNVVTLPTYTVSIGEGETRSVTEWELEIGESVDFAFYGIKDYSRDKVGSLPRYLCTWQSDDTTVLSKDNEAGLFTAVKAGTAKVTLTVANILTGQTHNVIPVTVTVKAEEPVATPTPIDVVADLNKTQNTIEIKFEEAKDLALADVEIFRVFSADDDNNGDGVIDARDAFEPYQDFYVNTVTANKDKTVYTAATFYDFVDGATYEVRVKGYEPEQFVASVGAVAKVVVFEDEQAVLASEDLDLIPALLDVKLYDAKGVDVTTRVVDGIANNYIANITYTLADEFSTAYSLGYNDVEFYEYATATVTATFELQGHSVTSAPITIWPSTFASYGVDKIVEWTLVKSWDKADWKNITHTVPAGETEYVIATLLKDTRGNYYTTHENSATAKSNVKYVDENGKEHKVLWTEDEDQSFWINGLYVEYKAMNPDQMLVETDGSIRSYEAGKARFALYLYNYNKYENEFVKELYSQYVQVCHPMALHKITANTTVNIMTDTETENDWPMNRTPYVADAYYNKFSKGAIEIYVWDIHGGWAKPEQGQDAEFAIELLTKQAGNEKDAEYAALKTLVEDTYLAALNSPADPTPWNTFESWENGVFYKIPVEDKDFDGLYDRTTIKFRITEKNTRSSVTVTINRVDLVPTVVNEWSTSDVAVVKEFEDNLKTYTFFEKFTLAATRINVNQKIYDAEADASYSTTNWDFAGGLKSTGYNVLLGQSDKNGHAIGFDSNIYIATSLNPYNVAYVDDSADLFSGDRVLIVEGPDKKAYTLVGNAMANPDYNKKLDGTVGATVATTSALGVQIIPAGIAESRTGTKTQYDQYNLVFRTADATTGEMIYAKDGQYTLTIKTVEYVDRDEYVFVKADKDKGEVATHKWDDNRKIYVTATTDATHMIKVDADGNQVKNKNLGNITYATSNTLGAKVIVNVKNDNADVKYVGRDNVYFEDSLSSAMVGDFNNIGDSYTMRKHILEAFNFSLADYGWTEAKDLADGDWKLSPEDILYYTYTVTPSNKQIVINSVTFKVPVVNREDWGDIKGTTGEWYRSTAIVNKSLTFEME